MKANAELTNLLKLCIDKEISDLHISVNTNPIGRIHGQLQSLCDHVYSEKELLELSQETLSQSEFSELKNERSMIANLVYSLSLIKGKLVAQTRGTEMKELRKSTNFKLIPSTR